MYCTNCGKEVNDNAVICVNCGVPVRGAYNPYASQPPYAQPFSRIPVEPKRVNGFGITGLVLGILSFFMGVYFCIFPILGLVFSIIGTSLRKKFNSCNGLAIAGLVLSILTLLFWGIILIMAIGMGNVYY